MIEIVLVDDEQEILTLFEFYFRKEIKAQDISIRAFTAGTELLDWLGTINDANQKIVLSDINMPDIDGLDLLKQIKERFSDLKVIMLTAYGGEQYMQEAKEFGADDFLTKPIDFDVLKSHIYKHLEK